MAPVWPKWIPISRADCGHCVLTALDESVDSRQNLVPIAYAMVTQISFAKSLAKFLTMTTDKTTELSFCQVPVNWRIGPVNGAELGCQSSSLFSHAHNGAIRLFLFDNACTGSCNGGFRQSSSNSLNAQGVVYLWWSAGLLWRSFARWFLQMPLSHTLVRNVVAQGPHLLCRSQAARTNCIIQQGNKWLGTIQPRVSEFA